MLLQITIHLFLSSDANIFDSLGDANEEAVTKR